MILPESAYRFPDTWTVTKPSVRASGGMVASQHALASEVGARVLAAGGNAVDAAVAAGVAIGTVEPWMSGLGGAGFMLVYLAAEDRAYAVDFGLRASSALDPGDYPLAADGTDDDLFGWPAVVDDRNVSGPLSVAVPGFVRGHALALERFGTRSWSDSVAPAAEMAARGMDVDWYATLKIASEARLLARDPECASTYLPGGFAPAGAWGGPLPGIRLGRLGDTLARLRDAGPEDFYTGQIAQSIASDCERLGVRVNAADLAACEARVVPIEDFAYRDARVYAAPGLSAGPTLRDALERLAVAWSPAGGAPQESAYRAYASALREAYARRLETLGDAGDSPASPSCTTHMSVADADGNCVALTQTLLSVFGSKVMLPGTGILMNNGVMWFDPRPGRPNSMAPGKRPLSNMCPTLVRRADGWMAALGASGGRRIMPAVLQLLSFMVDFRMDVNGAMHTPRIDVSGAPVALADRRLGQAVHDALAGDGRTETVQHGVYPALFACPNVVARHQGRGESEGGAFVMSPWAKVAVA